VGAPTVHTLPPPIVDLVVLRVGQRLLVALLVEIGVPPVTIGVGAHRQCLHHSQLHLRGVYTRRCISYPPPRDALILPQVSPFLEQSPTSWSRAIQFFSTFGAGVSILSPLKGARKGPFDRLRTLLPVCSQELNGLGVCLLPKVGKMWYNSIGQQLAAILESGALRKRERECPSSPMPLTC